MGSGFLGSAVGGEQAIAPCSDKTLNLTTAKSSTNALNELDPRALILIPCQLLVSLNHR